MAGLWPFSNVDAPEVDLAATVVPIAGVTLVAQSIRLFEIEVTNTTSAQHTVTFLDGNGVAFASITVPAKSTLPVQGVFMRVSTNGLHGSSDVDLGVQVTLRGWQ